MKCTTLHVYMEYSLNHVLATCILFFYWNVVYMSPKRVSPINRNHQRLIYMYISSELCVSRGDRNHSTSWIKIHVHVCHHKPLEIPFIPCFNHVVLSPYFIISFLSFKNSYSTCKIICKNPFWHQSALHV